MTRVPQQPLIRIDRNDYSIGPVFAGRRVEVRVSQREITATVLDTGELSPLRHSRIFAGFQTIVESTHQSQLKLQRQLRRHRHQVDVRAASSVRLRRALISVAGAAQLLSWRTSLPGTEGPSCGQSASWPG